jgi:hypothetical protein
LLPKFASEGAAMYHELRKRGTSHRNRIRVPCVLAASFNAATLRE